MADRPLDPVKPPRLDALRQDIRYALRLLRRGPGFSAMAICTLALGVGANSTIFSVINAVLLRPLPYPAPHRLVEFHNTADGQDNGATYNGRNYFTFRDHLKSYQAIASFHGQGGVNLVAGGRAENLSADRVTADYFKVLGVGPALGRAFTTQEEAVGGANVVILSHAVWTRHLNRDSSVLTRTVNLGGVPHQVVGVMPERFTTRPAVDVWLPLRPGYQDVGTNRGVVARLKDDVTWAQAQGELESLAPEIFTERHRQSRYTWRLALMPYQGTAADDLRTPLFVLMAAVLLVLLIACANIANLLLARATTRAREMALRATLGASRGRLVRQLLVESLVLSLLGGVGGLLVARMALPALLALSPVEQTFWGPIGLDRPVLFFVLGLSVLTGVLFGLVPALQATRGDLSEATREGGRSSAGRGSGLLRQGLIVSEVAVSLTLLVGALLLTRTFMNLVAVDPKFDPRHVMTARMSLAGTSYDTTEKVARLYRDALDRLRRLPGVERAAVINSAPMERGLNQSGLILGPSADGEMRSFDWRYVTADYFRVLDTPILRGRAFTERDTAAAPPVALVNEQFARRYFPNLDPIGQRVSFSPRNPTERTVEIVGIVPDLKQQSLDRVPPETMYVPLEQVSSGIDVAHAYFPVTWLVRTSGAHPDVAAAIQREMAQIDPTLPFIGFSSMDDRIAGTLTQQRFHMYLIGSCALLALLLAGAGLFGVIAYAVAQRTQEMGVRLALGATPSQLVRMIVRQGAVLAITGIVVGLCGAFAATRVLQSFLFGVSATDPLTFAASAALLLAIALAASFVPAWRVTSLDPALTLRKS